MTSFNKWVETVIPQPGDQVTRVKPAFLKCQDRKAGELLEGLFEVSPSSMDKHLSCSERPNTILSWLEVKIGIHRNTEVFRGYSQFVMANRKVSPHPKLTLHEFCTSLVLISMLDSMCKQQYNENPIWFICLLAMEINREQPRKGLCPRNL